MRLLSRGFSLVEVLVASLMIMLGVTGFVTLQSEFVRADSQLNLRNVALRLAQEKLDDLSLLSQQSHAQYRLIDTNQGGAVQSGAMAVVLGNNQQNQHAFNLSWDVTPWYFVDSDNDNVADLWVTAGHPLLLLSGGAQHSAQKEVSVKVDWLDNQGNIQLVRLNGLLTPSFQSRSAVALVELAEVNLAARVGYAASQYPDVIEQVTSADTVQQAASPRVRQSGSHSEVSLSVSKFQRHTTLLSAVQQDDFNTLSCECELAGMGLGSTPAMAIIENDVLRDQLGQLVTKMTGTSQISGQSVLCRQCCRDHHDSAQTITDEVFYRSENGLAHTHYKLLADGTYRPALTVGDEYDEVCRFKRIDGDFVLYQDWQLIDIMVLGPDYLQQTTNKQDYLRYQQQWLVSQLMGASAPSRPVGRDLDFNPGTFQFTARGLYLDRLRTSDQLVLHSKIAAGGSDWLKFVPFYDINLTLLADWQSAQPHVATISNDRIVTMTHALSQYYSSYSRGLLTTNAAGSSVISASAFGFNATLAGAAPVSPLELQSIKQDTSVSVR